MLGIVDAPPPFCLSPQPDLRVALLVLHAQSGGDFFGDTLLAWVGGELRARGIAADLIHVYYDREGGPAAQASVDRSVIAAVAACHVVVVDQAWDEALLSTLQAGGARLVVTDPFAVWQRLRVDVRLDRFRERPQTLIELAEALRDGQDLRQLPAMRMDLGGAELPLQTAPLPSPSRPPRLQPFRPIAVPRVIGHHVDLDGREPVVRRTIETSSGCPFADPVAANPRYAGVDLSDPRVTQHGCAFCFMGGDYRASSVADTVAETIAQIRYWQAHVPRLDEVILRDQSALRYLPDLIAACQADGLRPVGLLVPGRGDAILRWGPQLRAAAAACGEGWWFTIHLIGFESFSQRQLDLYNKGVTVAEYAEALRQMRALHRSHPQSFRLEAYGASSFVLFNPWTTLDELQETLDFCLEHAVGVLAHGLTLTRLRLYPNLPLYWLAQRDGLLVRQEREGQADHTAVGDPTPLGARHSGYSAEAAWRYADPRLAVVEQVQQSLARHVRPEQAVGLLQAVVQWARTGPRSAADGEAVVVQFLSLQGRWRQGALSRATQLAGPQVQAAQSRTVLAGRTCNLRCQTCVASHAEYTDDPQTWQPALASAARRGHAVLTGREPGLLRGLLAGLHTATQGQRSGVEVVSNGAVLAQPLAPRRLVQAGVKRLAIKRHRFGDADEDAFVQVAGHAARQRQGLAAAVAAGLDVAVMVLPVRSGWHELPTLVDWAADAGARAVRVQVLAAELPLDKLDACAAALDAAGQRAAARGLGWSLQGP